MRLKEMNDTHKLLLFTLSFLISACGQDNNDIELVSFIPAEASATIMQTKASAYMLSDFGGIYKDPISNGKGILTTNMSNLVKNIRQELARAGVDVIIRPSHIYPYNSSKLKDNETNQVVSFKNTQLYQRRDNFDAKLIKALVDLDLKTLREIPEAHTSVDLTPILCLAQYERTTLLRPEWIQRIVAEDSISKRPLDLQDEFLGAYLHQTESNVSQEQWKQWNDIILGELAKDPFWGNFFDRGPKHTVFALSAGTLTSNLSRSSRAEQGQVNLTHLKIDGASGGKIPIQRNLNIEVSGEMGTSKATHGIHNTLSYCFGNTTLGLIHAYANLGQGLYAASYQMETSVAVSHSFRNFFLEGQFGRINFNNMNHTSASGAQYQLTAGVDFKYITPFIQLIHRDINGTTQTKEYIGVECDVFKRCGESYSMNTYFKAKVGLSQYNKMEGLLEWVSVLGLKNGIAVEANLKLSSQYMNSAGLYICYEH